jgi:PIN domain nuclease of toxin-antitoxin system
MTYVVGTHGLVWFLEGSPRLGMAGQNALSDTAAQVAVPTIVLAEITFLYARDRIATDLPRVLVT